MKTLVRTAIVASLFLALAILIIPGNAPGAGEPTPDGVKLVSLKYNAFQAKLASAHKDKYKYTLVDAWASNCGPCKENFPHLIELNAKYGPKGLQVISLSLDDTSNTKDVEAARDFLTKKKATFLNVLLDEDFGVGYEKLNINAIPAVFLFGPDGKEVKRFTMDDANNQFTYEQVGKEIDKLFSGPAQAKN